MKLFGYTYVYNEEAMIPYVLPYILRMGYDKFVIYDDGCTDNTIPILTEKLSAAGIECEVRDTNFDVEYGFDGRKREAQILAIRECKGIIDETGEHIWMTFTDFDEVIYCSRERQECLKEYLEIEDKRGYNCFTGRMLHLTWSGNIKNDKLLPHQWENVRGTWWMSEGMKPTIIRVNDFKELLIYCGNHHMGAQMADGCALKDLSECGEFHGFHLKYFNGEVFKRKLHSHYHGTPERNLTEIIACSFPIEWYFFEKGLMAKKTELNERDGGEGIYLV